MCYNIKVPYISKCSLKILLTARPPGSVVFLSVYKRSTTINQQIVDSMDGLKFGIDKTSCYPLRYYPVIRDSNGVDRVRI